MSQADGALKEALKDYPSQVSISMGSNRFDVGNDALFEEWKSVARLSQSVTRIEQELRQIFEATSLIAGTKQLAAPVTRQIAASAAKLVAQVDATDVVEKSKGPLKRYFRAGCFRRAASRMDSGKPFTLATDAIFDQ